MAKYENIHFDKSSKQVNKYYDSNGALESKFEGDLYSRTSSSYTSRNRLFVSGSAGSLLTVVFAIILLVVVFRALTGGNGTLTFTGFLQRLSSFTTPFPDLAILDHTIRDGWGLFDGLRNFINIFIQLFDFVLFLAKSMTNVAAYVFDMVKFFFGF